MSAERRVDNVISENLVAVFGNRLDTLEESVQFIREQMETHIKITQEVANGTKDIVDFWREAKDAFALFNKIACVIRWTLKKLVLPLAVVFAALVAWKTGVVPTWLAKVAALAQ